MRLQRDALFAEGLQRERTTPVIMTKTRQGMHSLRRRLRAGGRRREAPSAPPEVCRHISGRDLFIKINLKMHLISELINSRGRGWRTQ